MTAKSLDIIFHDRKYQMCGLHVEKLALFGIIVVFVLTLCEVFFETAYNWPIYITIGFVLLELLSLLPIVIAQSVRNAKLYVPFIIIQALFLILTAIYWIIAVVATILALCNDKNVIDELTNLNFGFGSFGKPNKTSGERTFTVISIGAYCSLYSIFTIFYYIVIIRAFQYMRNEQKLDQTLPMPTQEKVTIATPS